jgi:hypothetical protein
MRQNPRLFRLSASVAIGALLCNAALPAAMAQPAAPLPVVQTPAQYPGDPPARVGRIAGATGAVAFRTSADTQWSPATTNYPVSSGNAFWTEPAARAELEISASRIDLSGQTEFDVTTLDAGGLQAAAPQGELYLHLNDLAPNEVWSVQTPRGQVRLTEPGRYGILVGTTEQPTQITVLEGAASIDGPGVSLTIAANQTATITGNGPFEASLGPAVRDAFLAARLAADRARPAPPAPVAARLQYLPGADSLSDYGHWGEAPDYGEVWYPSVAPGWVPYQDGHWAYVAPWGWTWVDSAPWGFVPFHYGRWAHIHGRWGWLPGDRDRDRDRPEAERPVYAPALVTFIGLSAGVAVGAAIAHGSIGWVPLGPGEAYHPWYHASGGYLRQINSGHVRDPAAIGNTVAVNTLVNRSAATEVPAGVMLGSRPVRGAAHPVPPQAFAEAHPVIGEQPIRPVVGTMGVTPAVAHQLNLQPAAGIVPPRPVPGPVVRVQEPGTPNGSRPLPGLVGPHGEPSFAPHPGEPGERAPGILRPGMPAPGMPARAMPAPGVPAPGVPAPGVPVPGEVHGPGLPSALPGVRPGSPPEPREGNHPGGLYAPSPSGGPEAFPRPGPSGSLYAPRPAIPEAAPRPPPGPGPVPEGLRHEGAPPGVRPEVVPPPGGRPGFVPQVGEPRPAVPPPPRPGEGIPRPAAIPEPANRLPLIERPTERAPEIHQPPPRIEQPRLPPPPPRVELPHPAPPPRIEQPPPPRMEQPRPAPRVEPPQPPPPHPEPPRPPPPQEKRPGER